MSNMLEQAIIDAEALKEAAIKNAENSLIEKYSDQIKEAVEFLLEQPETDMLEDELTEIEGSLEEDEGLLGDSPVEEADVATKQVPLAAMEGQNACPCPEEDDQVDINLSELESAMELHESMLEEERELDLDEEVLVNILETLKVDIHPEKSGWAGRPESQVRHAEEQMLACLADDDYKEKYKEISNTVKELENLKESLENEIKEKNSKIKQKNNSIIQLANAVENLKENLDKMSVQNARLLYTNKALISNSLNERQKSKIAESISKSETVEEARVIYETLQNAVGSTSNKKQPKSLSEAVNRSNSTVLLSRHNIRREQKKGEPAYDRWLALAGIDKKQ